MPVIINESDLNYILLILGTIIILTIFGLRFWWNIRHNAPEAELFLEARRYLNPPPLLIIEGSDGNGVMTLGKTDKKGDIVFKIQELGGVQIDPRKQGVCPTDRINGIPVFHYSTVFPFALSSKNAQAFKAVIRYTRQTYPEVSFISDLRLLELIALPVDQLLHDCTNVIETMEQNIPVDSIGLNSSIPEKAKKLSDALAAKLGLSKDEQNIADEAVELELSHKVINAAQLVTIIKAIQAESHVIAINKGFFSFEWAFQVIPSSILAQDMHQFELLLKKQLALSQANDYQKFIYVGFAVLLVCVGVAILFMLKK